MSTKQKTQISESADECVIAYFNVTRDENVARLTNIIKKSALFMSYVSECIGLHTAYGFVAHTDSDDDFVSKKLGRVKLDRESVIGLMAKQGAILDTLCMHIPSRHVEDPVTDNSAALLVEVGDKTDDEFVCDNLGHSLSCVRTDGIIVLAIRTDRLCNANPEDRGVLIADICRLAAELDCYYGYVQCESHADTLAGSLYDDTFNAPFTMHAIVRELAWWHPLTNRQNLARGVYWGNFFGPSFTQLLDKHGILQQLTDYQVRDPVKDMLVPGKQRVQRFSNGSSFFSLTDDVLHSSNWLNDHLEVASKLNLPMVPCHARDRDDPYLMLAAWLHCKLRSIGALL